MFVCVPALQVSVTSEST